MIKKHLHSLAIALAITLPGQAAVLWTTTFNGTDNTARTMTSTAAGDFTDTLTSSYALTFNGTTPSPAFRTGTGNPVTTFNPDKNVDNAAGAGWNSVFDFNGGTQTISLSGITFNIVRFNSTGAIQASDATVRSVLISGEYTLNGGTTWTSLAATQTVNLTGSNTTTPNIALSFDLAAPVTVNLASADFQIRYTVLNDGTNAGAYNGITSIVANGSVVPEPGAALLGSLGALALLRRRR
jgi:hypothetical protein